MKKTGPLWALPPLALMLFVQSTQAGETVRCNPYSGPSYKLCEVRNMGDMSVRLSRQLSSTPCVQGKSWGRNKRGVWVDKGCRAEFDVTRRGGGHQHDDDEDHTAAIAVGVGLAAAMLAAAAASDGGSSSVGDRHHGNNYGNSHRPSDGYSIPRFVFKRCNQYANDEVRSQRGGRYAELDRVEKEKRTRNGYRLKAYYRLSYNQRDRVRLAVCDVSEDRRVTRFEFK